MMKKEEIKMILKSCVALESADYRPPSEDEWRAVESRFSCQFPLELRDFIDLMSEFDFPGEILNVGSGPNNGNDSIELTYDFEMRKHLSWSADMIPFYAIGNGDYFCVSSSEGTNSAVYYYYAERPGFERYCDSFGIWLKQLPDFLS